MITVTTLKWHFSVLCVGESQCNDDSPQSDHIIDDEAQPEHSINFQVESYLSDEDELIRLRFKTSSYDKFSDEFSPLLYTNE